MVGEPPLLSPNSKPNDDESYQPVTMSMTIPELSGTKNPLCESGSKALF